MHKGRYCFKVKHIDWQNIRRDKQWYSMGSSISCGYTSHFALGEVAFSHGEAIFYV